MTMPSILLLSKLTTFWACRLASSVLGRFISKNLKYATPASAMTARMREFLHFILNAALPPHHRSNQRGHQRYEHQKNPAQPAQRLFVKTEVERLRDLRRDTDKLFPTKQPVHTAGDEVEALLVLRDRVVLNECCVTHYYQARRIHLDPLICAAPFFDCRGDCQRHITVLLRVGLSFCLVVRVVV